jgi:hypothetical protein
MVKCTKLEDIFKPENAHKRYSEKFVVDLIVEHLPNCEDCFKLWKEKYAYREEVKQQ